VSLYLSVSVSTVLYTPDQKGVLMYATSSTKLVISKFKGLFRLRIGNLGWFDHSKISDVPYISTEIEVVIQKEGL